MKKGMTGVCVVSSIAGLEKNSLHRIYGSCWTKEERKNSHQIPGGKPHDFVLIMGSGPVCVCAPIVQEKQTYVQKRAYICLFEAKVNSTYLHSNTYISTRKARHRHICASLCIFMRRCCWVYQRNCPIGIWSTPKTGLQRRVCV